MTSTEGDSTLHRLVSKPVVIAVLAIICLGLISATAYRTVKNYSPPANQFDWGNRGHSDFHNGSYFPAIAFRNGVNPYSPMVMEKYPVASPSRPCPPITFVLHLPFTVFELPTADIVFFVYNTCLLLLLAFLTVTIVYGRFHAGWWLSTCAILLISRPGHITLFTGYYTLELVIGTVLAIHYGKTKPWLAALGMLLASSKPTFILPLILLMLARKNFRATVIGVILCTAFGLGGLAWLAQESSFSGVVDGIIAGQEAFHTEEEELPVNSWTRVDLLGLFAKMIDWQPDDKVYLLGMLVLMTVPCIAIFQIADREQDSGITGLSGLVALLTMLICIYHHSYDCLLIALPCIGLLFFSEKILPEANSITKRILGILLLVPMLNYVSTRSVRSLLEIDPLSFTWQSITLFNGLSLLLAFLISMICVWQTAVSHTIQKDFGR